MPDDTQAGSLFQSRLDSVWAGLLLCQASSCLSLAAFSNHPYLSLNTTLDPLHFTMLRNKADGVSFPHMQATSTSGGPPCSSMCWPPCS